VRELDDKLAVIELTSVSTTLALLGQLGLNLTSVTNPLYYIGYLCPVDNILGVFMPDFNGPTYTIDGVLYANFTTVDKHLCRYNVPIVTHSTGIGYFSADNIVCTGNIVTSVQNTTRTTGPNAVLAPPNPNAYAQAFDFGGVLNGIVAHNTAVRNNIGFSATQASLVVPPTNLSLVSFYNNVAQHSIYDNFSPSPDFELAGNTIDLEAARLAGTSVDSYWNVAIGAPAASGETRRRRRRELGDSNEFVTGDVLIAVVKQATANADTVAALRAVFAPRLEPEWPLPSVSFEQANAALAVLSGDADALHAAYPYLAKAASDATTLRQLTVH
jgi:hypothetical protein